MNVSMRYYSVIGATLISVSMVAPVPAPSPLRDNHPPSVQLTSTSDSLFGDLGNLMSSIFGGTGTTTGGLDQLGQELGDLFGGTGTTTSGLDGLAQGLAAELDNLVGSVFGGATDVAGNATAEVSTLPADLLAAI